MLENVHHNCGIAAVSFHDTSKNVVPALYKLLINMQNRGQLSAGITTYNSKRPHLLKTHKDIGSVNEVFRIGRPDKMRKMYRELSGNKGIGHVRYATCGENDVAYAQPFERTHGRKFQWFSMCFNGNIANFPKLREELLQKTDYHLILNSDTEVIMHNLSRQLRGGRKPDIVKVFSRLAKKFDGAYNIAMVNAYGDIIVNRDPVGIRPLVWGKMDGNVYVASESNALINMGVTNYKDLEPGTLLHIHNGDVEIKRYAKSDRIAHCMFEWIYFANVSSVIDRKSVYITRRNLGNELAKMEKEKMTKDHIVVPVPDTSKPAAEAMSFKLGIPMMEGLIRNRYIGRTFIENSSRNLLIKNKFTAIREILKGKKVLLVDDSIVRGTTVKEIIKFIKKAGGAKEVHLRISCPAVMAPCFYGIDMSTKSELLVPHYERAYCGEIHPNTSERLAKDLGADSITFMTHEGLVKSIGIPKSKLCMACLNCQYPTKEGYRLYEKSLKEFLEKKAKGRAGKR